MGIDELTESVVQRAERARDEGGPDVPAGGASGSGAYVRAAAASPDVEALYANDVAEIGHVMNLSRVWSHHPAVLEELFALLTRCVRAAGLTLRQRGVLVSACASTLGDAYCSLAWGARLAREAGPEIAAAVLRGDDDGLDATEAALARWARAAPRAIRTPRRPTTWTSSAGPGSTTRRSSRSPRSSGCGSRSRR